MAEMAMNPRRAAITEARERKTKKLEDEVDAMTARVERLMANGTTVALSAHIRILRGKLPT